MRTSGIWVSGPKNHEKDIHFMALLDLFSTLCIVSISHLLLMCVCCHSNRPVSALLTGVVD